MPISFASPVITITGGIDSGTATAGASTTLTNSGKAWTTNAFANRHVWIFAGTGAAQVRKIVSNTATVLTVDRAFAVNPASGSQYIVCHNFADIKAANDAGGWGVVTQQGPEFRFNARIYLGDGTTGNRGALSDFNKHVTFQTGLVNAADFFQRSHIAIRDHSGLFFGNILNVANKTSAEGCAILSEETTNTAFAMTHTTSAGGIPAADTCTVQVVSSKFASVTNPVTARTAIAVHSGVSGSCFWNSDFDRVELTPGNLDTFNVNVIGAQFGVSRVIGAFDRAIVANIVNQAAYTHSVGEAASVFRNLRTRNVGSWFGFFNNTTVDCFMVNPDADAKTIWYEGSGSTARLWEQYEFDLTVLRASNGLALANARVFIRDSTGTQVLNVVTDANGAIPQRLLNRGFYTGAGGNTLTARTPHTLRVRAYGFQPLELSISVGSKSVQTDYRTADPYVVASAATAAAYTGIAVSGAGRTITVSGARTLQELYDYLMWWCAESSNVGFDVPISTTDGLNFALAANWVLIGPGNVTFGTRRLSGALRFTAAGAYSPALGTATLTFTAAGTYDLRTASITGTVTLVNTSGGAVTVQLQPGVAFVNSGPNITVDNAVAATFTVSGLVSSSRLLIRRTDTQAVLVNEVVAGTSRAYTYTHTADIPVEIVARKATGSPAYQEWRTTATLTAAGGAVAASQQLDE